MKWGKATKNNKFSISGPILTYDTSFFSVQRKKQLKIGTFSVKRIFISIKATNLKVFGNLQFESKKFILRTKFNELIKSNVIDAMRMISYNLLKS